MNVQDIAQRAQAGVLRCITTGHLPDFSHTPPPATFAALTRLLVAGQSAGCNAREIVELAQTIAIACHGQRHLWEDLGLAGRTEISTLLAHYFRPLRQRNVLDLRWKRFLFGKLGLQPPGCSQCDQSPVCFGAQATRQD